MSYATEAAAEFAGRIRALGFRVFLAKTKDYGFVTDESESRVLSFSFTGCVNTLSGNYGPPTTTAGTGWRMEQYPEELRTKEDVKSALYAYPPSFCCGWDYPATVKQYLSMYGNSSGFTEVI